jgi:hypothetical protein
MLDNLGTMLHVLTSISTISAGHLGITNVVCNIMLHFMSITSHRKHDLSMSYAHF